MRRGLIGFIALVGLWIGGLMIGIWLGGAITAQQREKQVQKSVTREHGRVVEVQSTKLRKFDKPVTRVPTIVPPKREGHSWHWHPNYGWIAIVVESAPREVLLPVTYQLPAQVIHYELTAGAAVAGGGGAVGHECQLTCPHCGEVITISVR